MYDCILLIKFMEILERIIIERDKNIRRIGRLYFQIKMYLIGNKHPSSYPYVSGDSFRALANHILDKSETFTPSEVKAGDIVFVGQGFIYEYLQTLHKNITHQYILICHNGDASVDEKIVNLIDDKIIHFFAQNVTCVHKKITPIPIGLENLRLYINGIISVFSRLKRKIEMHPTIRKDKIFYNFSIDTNPQERGIAKDYLDKHPLSETTKHFLAPRRHLKKLLTYKFVASPPGNGIESSRTWEALYIKTIPIVKNSVSMQFFRSLGLPVWIINNWEELNEYTEKDLEEKYNSLTKSACLDALYMDFWIDKIHAKQQSIYL